MNETATIVLLPGLLCDASIWASQKQALERHAVVRVSDFSRHDSITNMALSALSSAKGDLVAIGHSMGARVAMEMVRIAPQRIKALGLIDTGMDPRRSDEETSRQVLIDVAFADGMSALADRWLPPMVHEGRTADASLMEPLKSMVLRASPAQYKRQIKALLNRPDARAGLKDIECPALVMVGRQDRWSPLAQHEVLASLIPHSELVVIEDSGHMSLVEQPQQVSDALVRWLGFDAATSNDADRVRDRIPDVPLFDRKRSLQGYRINKMAMGLGLKANRDAFVANEEAYLDRFALKPEEKRAVMSRDWREMVRLGGNLFFILKISAIDPVRMTEIGAHQAGMDHADFLKHRLGKK